MKIAVASNGNTLEHVIPEEFEKSTYLLIIETDDLRYEVHANDDIGGSGISMTQTLIASNCEALISGSIDQPAFDVLAIGQITRYWGTGLTAMEALQLMEKYKLDFIRDPKGGESGLNHDHQSCNCDDH